MGLIRQIALAILSLSFAVFVSFFGSLPVFRYSNHISARAAKIGSRVY
jgi:hypothetical protein